MASGCLSGGAVVEIETKQQARAASFHLANRTASYVRNSIAERVLWNNFRNGLNPVSFLVPARRIQCVFPYLAYHDSLQLTQQWAAWSHPVG